MYCSCFKLRKTGSFKSGFSSHHLGCFVIGKYCMAFKAIYWNSSLALLMIFVEKLFWKAPLMCSKNHYARHRGFGGFVLWFKLQLTNTFIISLSFGYFSDLSSNLTVCLVASNCIWCHIFAFHLAFVRQTAKNILNLVISKEMREHEKQQIRGEFGRINACLVLLKTWLQSYCVSTCYHSKGKKFDVFWIKWPWRWFLQHFDSHLLVSHVNTFLYIKAALTNYLFFFLHLEAVD